MPTEISVPFRLDGNGRVVTTSNLDAQVRLHVLALLNTIPEERAMVPGYGTDLVNLVFEDADPDEVSTQASMMVRDAFATHEPGVQLVKADPVEDTPGNLAQVDVEYRRLDAPDSGSVANTNTAIIGASGAVREIVRG